jgi:hypothetical protein
VALPRAYAPAGIALGIMGSTRPSHHVEVTTLREGYAIYLYWESFWNVASLNIVKEIEE